MCLPTYYWPKLCSALYKESKEASTQLFQLLAKVEWEKGFGNEYWIIEAITSNCYFSIPSMGILQEDFGTMGGENRVNKLYGCSNNKFFHESVSKKQELYELFQFKTNFKMNF